MNEIDQPVVNRLEIARSEIAIDMKTMISIWEHFDGYIVVAGFLEILFSSFPSTEN
jgi:hypothetical protein